MMLSLLLLTEQARRTCHKSENYLHHDVVTVDSLLRFVDPALCHILAAPAQMLKANQPFWSRACAVLLDS